jgi:hypothetical protein
MRQQENQEYVSLRAMKDFKDGTVSHASCIGYTE